MNSPRRLARALYCCAPFRKPHGETQISSCCAQAVFVGWMFCVNGASTAGPPVTGTAYVWPVDSSAGFVKSIVRR